MIPVKIIILVCFILPHLKCFAVDTTRLKAPHILGYRQHKGFIIPHATRLKPISGSYPDVFELDYSRQLTDKQSWDYCFCYPRAGISLLYIDFQNPDVIGESVNLSGYIEPFFTYSRKLNFSYRFGVGISYLNNPYDSISNPDNLFYSTYISYLVLLKISLNYRMNNHWNFRLSGNYNHISNGGIKKPNAGINFPTANLGVDYIFNPKPLEGHKRVKKQLYPKKQYVHLSVFGTGKTRGRNSDKRYPVYGAYADYSYLFTRMNAFSAGMELEINGALKSRIADQELGVDHKRFALMAGHKLYIGRFRFSQLLGVYLYNPYGSLDPVYQRYELVLFLSKKVYAGVNLKSHLHVADFMDVRVGIEL